ncbi:hypothetical protein HDR61_03960 [bacterium]|nr:hypothetical protein [bacterium]
MLDKNLIRANEDIITITTIAKSIGWGAVSEQSFQRVLYLVQILYSFKHVGENIFSYYHFIVTTFGPYSDLIERSLVFMKSSSTLREEEGGLCLNTKKQIPYNKDKVEWLKSVLYMLGKYGEKRLFGFIVNDPSYENATQTNNVGGIDTSSSESETLKTLNDFKVAFEQTIEDTSAISDEKYIELYFEYIFSQIIK